MADTVPAMDKQEEEMSESSNSSKKPPFFKGQRVFAKDETSGILYEAVVRRTMFGMTRQRQIHQHEDENEIEEEKEEWHCFVHYLGWNVMWDRWVSQSYIYEWTDKNLELAKKLQEAVKEAKKKHGRKSPHIMVELQARMKQLEQERRLEERREELAKQGIIMQELDQQQATKEFKTAKFTKAYFKKELELRKEDLQGKRKQSHAEKLVLPFSLKKVLVEEWEVIQCGMIPSLPVERAITVRQVLDNYLESKIGKFASSDDAVEKVENASKDQETTGAKMEASETSKSEEELPVDASVENAQSQRKKDPEKDELTKKQDQEWKEMVEGIALLFDQAIDARLLYRQELPLREWILQHDDLGKRRYCQVFGCEHLLRLFIRLPALLADQLSDAESRPILSKLNDFVRYLQKHQDRIFLQSYQHPPREEPAPRKRPAEGTAATKRGGAKRGRNASAKEVISKDATTNDDMETKVAASLSVGES